VLAVACHENTAVLCSSGHTAPLVPAPSGTAICACWFSLHQSKAPSCLCSHTKSRLWLGCPSQACLRLASLSAVHSCRPSSTWQYSSCIQPVVVLPHILAPFLFLHHRPFFGGCGIHTLLPVFTLLAVPTHLHLLGASHPCSESVLVGLISCMRSSILPGFALVGLLWTCRDWYKSRSTWSTQPMPRRSTCRECSVQAPVHSLTSLRYSSRWSRGCDVHTT